MAENKFPKYLVECDFEAFEGAMENLPTKKLWVARMRDPFCLTLVDVTASDQPAPITVQFWPAIIEGDRPAIAEKMCRALFRHHDLYPGDWSGPQIGPIPEPPPEFIHMIRPAGNAEYILEPHAPRLWRVSLNSRLDTSGATWWKGFGVQPNFPGDLRRVTEFLAELG